MGLYVGVNAALIGLFGFAAIYHLVLCTFSPDGASPYVGSTDVKVNPTAMALDKFDLAGIGFSADPTRRVSRSSAWPWTAPATSWPRAPLSTAPSPRSTSPGRTTPRMSWGTPSNVARVRAAPRSWRSAGRARMPPASATRRSPRVRRMAIAFAPSASRATPRTRMPPPPRRRATRRRPRRRLSAPARTPAARSPSHGSTRP
jgi:hypothetical protein